MAQSAWRAMTGLALFYMAILLVLSGVNVLAPQPNGLLALSQIAAPLLFLPLPLFVPLALARVSSRARALRRWLRIVVVACAIVAVVRFVPAWIPAQSTSVPGGPEIGVTSWNAEGEEPEPATVVAALRDAKAGVVGLEELAKQASAAIDADPTLLERFPYRLLAPSDGSLGIGLLSSYPFVGTPTVALDPPRIHAALQLGTFTTLDVIVTHPQPGQLQTVGVLPDFDTSGRDAEIATIRSEVDPLVAAGKPLVLLGDFNLTDRESIYAELSAGLVDVGRTVGWGPGSTWRPDPVKWLPFGLLRIDMIFVTNGPVPLNISPDCTQRGSDHCIVRAALAAGPP